MLRLLVRIVHLPTRTFAKVLIFSAVQSLGRWQHLQRRFAICVLPVPLVPSSDSQRGLSSRLTAVAHRAAASTIRLTSSSTTSIPSHSAHTFVLTGATFVCGSLVPVNSPRRSIVVASIVCIVLPWVVLDHDPPVD